YFSEVTFFTSKHFTHLYKNSSAKVHLQKFIGQRALKVRTQFLKSVSGGREIRRALLILYLGTFGRLKGKDIKRTCFFYDSRYL
ncbi:MAG: hypothetical protein AAF635_16525, partial [Cyanobacteria bacterium P01_C01_bin.69]